MDTKKLNNILTIIVIIAVVAIAFLGSTVSKNNKKIDEILALCGDRCTGAFIDFGISGVNDALSAINGPKEEIKACMDNSDEANTVNDQFSDAVEMGLTSTPTSIVLNRETGLAVKIPGAAPKELISQIIDALTNDVAEGDVLFDFTDQGLQIVVEKIDNLPDVVGEDNKIGNGDSKYALIEYSDFDCPYCATFHLVMEDLVKERNDVLWVFRHFPLRSIHPEAQKKAEASECVKNVMGNEGFWDFASAIYSQSDH